MALISNRRQEFSLSSQEIQDFIFAIAAAAGGPCFVARQSGLAVSRDQGQNWQPAYTSLALDQDIALENLFD